MTFATWAEARDVAANPEGRAPNLIANHLDFIIDALIDLQQKVPCYRVGHRDAIAFQDTFWDCGATVVEAPRGFISKLYTVTADNCNKVYYTPVTKKQLECKMFELRRVTTLLTPNGYYYDDYSGTNVDYPELSYGLEYAEGTTDKTSRACTGYYTLENGQFWLYPSIQSTETVWVEWDGIKRDWDASDVVTFDHEIGSAVEDWLRGEMARTELYDPLVMKLANDKYNDTVAQMIWQCRKERRLPSKTYCWNNSGCSSVTNCC